MKQIGSNAAAARLWIKIITTKRFLIHNFSLYDTFIMKISHTNFIRRFCFVFCFIYNVKWSSYCEKNYREKTMTEKWWSIIKINCYYLVLFFYSLPGDGLMRTISYENIQLSLSWSSINDPWIIAYAPQFFMAIEVV